MRNDPETGLTPSESRDLRCIAGIMIPASHEFDVPGADDATIVADIMASLGRDLHEVRAALAELSALADGSFADLDSTQREALAQTFLAGGGKQVTTLGRVILQCYYRDDRVVRSLGAGAAAAVPEGAHLGTRRLVAAGCGADAPEAVARRTVIRCDDAWRHGVGAEMSGGNDMAAAVAAHDAKRTSNDIVDVLIIGSGASGAAVAWSLAETKMRILCLEQGDWMKNSDFPSNGRDWEARRFADFDISPNRRGAADGLSGQRRQLADEDRQLQWRRWRHRSCTPRIFPRMHPSDFRVRSLDGMADDWPIDYWTLEPFFAENDRMMGVSGLAGDPGVPPRNPPMPPIPLGKTGTRYARAMNKLGWHWWPSDTTVATTEYDGRAPCINLGHCTPGCAQGAKASTDITYWPLALRAGVELRTRCRVREITTNEHGMASGAIYYDADGVEQFQPAEVVILACNGIGTPRLLLNSASSRFPNGLANSSGLVGKNLMLHPWPQVVRLCRRSRWTATARR